MKLRQLFENGGLIVPGVNTTADVGPDEIKKQAAKFGNKVDKQGKPAHTFHSKAHKNTNPNTLFNLGMTESKNSITYTDPNFDNEWGEAKRYKEFKNIGKDKWIELAKKGKVVDYDTETVKKIKNTEAGNVKDWDKIDPVRKKRVVQQLKTGKIELPIVASYSDGWLELVGGNTRLTAAIRTTGKGKVWQFDVPDNLEEGKSPHKKGTAKYKKHMAAKHANMAEGDLDDVNKTSEIYVDMDGVLVDFFGAWTKLMGVKNWKDIKNINVGLDKIRSTKDFWINLKPTANADNLLGIIKAIKGNYKILSAPMADDHRVEPSKRDWVKKHLKAFPPDEVIITTNKKQYAVQIDGTPNILIDDFGQNVAKWEAAGGIGFKHKDHKFERTAKALDKHFKESTISEGDLKMKYHDFKQFVADRVKQPQKGFGRDEYDPRLLKKIYELLSGHDVTWDGKQYTIHDVEHSPRAMARKGRNPATERELSKGEEKEKERIVKGMKKDKKGFAKRYGKDAKAVMYATATKLAKG